VNADKKISAPVDVADDVDSLVVGRPRAASRRIA
jgi:hypothetical protein